MESFGKALVESGFGLVACIPMPLSFYRLFQFFGREANQLLVRNQPWVLCAIVLCLIAGLADCLRGNEDALFSIAFFTLTSMFLVLKVILQLAVKINALAYSPVPLVEALPCFVGTAYRHLLDETVLPDRDPVRTALLPPPLAPTTYSLV